MNRIETDILVIGGGIAGLTAAIEARRSGARVLLVGKRQPGRSGNSLLAAGNITCLPSKDDDQVLGLIQDTLQAGRNIADHSLVEILARRAPAAVDFLRSVGVQFYQTATGLRISQVPGHAQARTAAVKPPSGPLQTAGLAMTLPLLSAARQAGVTTLAGHPVIQILVAGGRVCGAIALDPRGELIELKAGAIILACGGGGRLYSHSNNCSEMTGDGLSLAWQAGCILRDLEFIQFHPTMGRHPVRVIFPNALFADGAVLRNRYGKRFLLGHGGIEKDTTRDQMSRAIWEEIQAGRDVSGGVYLDLSDIATAVIESRYQQLWTLLRHHGVDPAQTFVQVGLAVHFFMGGVQIDDRAATNIQGLYACGEVTGGIHGANRLAGNALLEAVVFGQLAGQSACGNFGVVPFVNIGHDLFQSYGYSSLQALQEIRRDIKELLWQFCGVIRCEDGFALGVEKLDELDRKFQACAADGWHALYFEIKGMLTSARLLLTAARLRKESRGAHFRSDFPYADDPEWSGFITLQKGDGPSQIIHRFSRSESSSAF